MAIHRYLDVSTGFVTQADMDLLTAGAPYCVADYAEGAFVYLPATLANGQFEPDWRMEMRDNGFSDRFCDLVEYARVQGCRYIRLDCDADDEIPGSGLTYVEW